MTNKALGSTWKEVRKEIFTSEEILESALRVALMGEIIKTRHDEGLSQKKLEELSGVKQPVIARIGMEKGTSDPKLTTMIKVLNPLGKTLAVVPIHKKRKIRLKAPFILATYSETKDKRP